jgi:hypothetical protein
MPLTAEAKYQLVQRFLFDPVFYKTYLTDQELFLKQLGASNEDDANEILAVLNQLQLGRLYAESQTEEYKKIKAIYDKSTADTMATGDAFKSSIRESLNQINTGYKVVMRMYVAAFLTGIGLIIAAIIMAVTQKENLLSIIFGSLGTMEILVFFFTKPALHLQSSRIRHAQLEMGFYGWFLDVYNINSYMATLNGKTDKPEMYDRLITVLDKQMAHTKEIMQSLKDFTGSTASDV